MYMTTWGVERVGVVNVDSPIPESLLQEIRSCPSIRFARVVQL